MVGSHQKKFIFFHLYKVAGSSLRHVLEKYQDFKAPKHFPPSRWINKHGRRLFDSYYTFAFVRNPWDWQVSLYFYMLKDKKHHQHDLAKSFRNFDEYIDWRVHHDCKSQYLWLSDNYDENSPISLNFVGRFEALHEDFNWLANHLNIQGVIPHLNKSDHVSYKQYYNHLTWKMIEDAYAIDIKTFNYQNDFL